MSIRGGFGTSYVHYTRAGSGDIAAINAPQAQFAAVSQIAPTMTNHAHATSRADHRHGNNNGKLLRDASTGFSRRTW